MDSLFGLGKKLRLRALSSGSVRVGRLCWRLTFRKGVWRRWWLVVLWPYSLAYFWLTRDALGAVARLERPVFGVARVRLGSEFNSHFLVAGMSGAGKSSFCKALAVELSRAGKSVCVLDVNGEYADCVRSVGGRVYATGSVGISLWELDGCSPVDRSAENCGILRRVLGLGDVQAIFLSRVVAAAYKAKGIREEDRASWGREPPVMADLLRACDALYAQRKDESLAGLRRRLEGLAATRVFGSKTVLPLSSVACGAVCFDLSFLRSRDSQALFVELFLRRLNSYLESQKGANGVFVFLDEAQALCRPCAGEPSFVGEVMRMGRKYGFSLVVSSQSLSGLDSAVVSNAGVPVLFQLRGAGDVEAGSRLLSGRGFSEKSGFIEHELSVLGKFEFLSRLNCGRDVCKVSFKPPCFPVGNGFAFDSENQRLAYQSFRELLPSEEMRYCDKSVLGGLELDFVFPKRKAAVEWNGTYFHSLPGRAEKDERKKGLLERMGWRLFTVEDDGMAPEAVQQAVSNVAREL